MKRLRRSQDRRSTGGTIIVLTVLALGLLGGCTETPETVELLDEPPLPSDPSQLDSSVAQLIQSHADKVRASPNESSTWSSLAKAYQANELMDLAEICWEQSLARNPIQPDAWYHRARVAESLGSPELAAEYVSRSLEYDATYAASWWRKGDWELELGRIDAAEASFRRATELDPDDPQGAIGLARVSIEQGETQAGANLLETVVKDHPGEAYAHFLLGNVYRTLGREEDAKAELGQGFGARIIRKDVWGAELIPLRVAFGSRVQLATQYMNDGQLDAAANLFDSLRQERPNDVRVLTKLGQTYLRQQRVTESLGVLFDALQRHPDDAKVHLELTAAFMIAGDTAKAMEHVNRSIQLNPSYGLAHARKATLLNRLGETELAAVSFEEALKYDPAEYRLWKSLGDCQAKLRRWDAAAKSYRRALQTQRKDAELFALFGLASLQSNRLEEAERALERSLVLGPREREQVEKMLGEVRRRQAAAGAG